MRPLLHIIEPTLSNHSGHCYHHVSTLVGANEFFDVKVWMDKSGSGLFKGYDCEEISFLVGRSGNSNWVLVMQVA